MTTSAPGISGEVPAVDIPLTDPNYHHFRESRPSIKRFCQNASGTILDFGCGKKPFADWFSDDVTYFGFDIAHVDKEVDFMASALDVPISDNSVDHVFSTQVIEHLQNPFKFFNEVQRVLKPGGSAFIATPQMWPLHEEPNDYFRFTRYGLTHLAESAGLEVTETVEAGNLMMRLCSKLAYVYNASPLGDFRYPIALLNLLFLPLVRFSFRKDYIFVGIVAEKHSVQDG